jgi:uncharacterized protein
MKLYFDSSALVRLVRAEAETPALRAFIRAHGQDVRITSTLARTEVARAAQLGGGQTVRASRNLLLQLDQIEMDRSLLDAAGALVTRPPMRSLDAIHLATAQSVTELRAVITYDARMAAAGEALGLPVATPV